MMPISLLIVADTDRRAWLRTEIAAVGGVEIVGEIAEAAALRLVPALAPDVVLLDGTAAGLNPLLAIPALCALPDAPRVVYVAGTGVAAERRLALELGAVAVLDAPAQLRQALSLGRDLTRLSRSLVPALRAA
jgi:DNA-binding NarL/FixJ family response regulator